MTASEETSSSQGLPGVPDILASADLDDSAVHLQVDDTLYPLEALYGAAFTFIDRCFVFIDRPEPRRYRIVLSTKKRGADEEQLRALVGEFANELLACAWRHQITQQNRATIESVTMQAMAGAMGPPSLDELEEFDFSEEPFDDPLGIAMSWEEKYGQKGAAKDSSQTGSGERSQDEAARPTEEAPSSPAAGEPAAGEGAAGQGVQ